MSSKRQTPQEEPSSKSQNKEEKPSNEIADSTPEFKTAEMPEKEDNGKPKEQLPAPNPFEGADPGGAAFMREMLEGDRAHGFNGDRIQYHPEQGWILFEFLRCVNTPPQQSHPNRYWFRNSAKFRNLWRLSQDLQGTLYLINYSDDRDQGVRQIQVMGLDDKGLQEEQIKNLSFLDFKEWFRELNGQCAPPELS